MMHLRTYLLRTQWPLWCVFLLVGVLSVGTNLWSTQTALSARTAQDALRDINALLLSVVNLETGVRGYALTKEPAFLEPYRQGQMGLNSQLRVLRAYSELSSTESASRIHIEQLGRIETLMNTWFQDIAASEINRAPGPPDAPAELKRSRQGKILIDAVREQVAMYAALETKEMQARQLDAAHARQFNTITIIVGILGAIVLSIFSSLTVARNLSRKFGRLADAAEQLAETERAQPIQGFHILEAARLASSFNQMAEKLELSHHQLLERNAQLEVRNREVTATNDLAEHLQTCRSLEEGYRVLGEVLPRVFSDASGLLATINSSRNLLVPRVSWGRMPACDLVDPAQCWALRRGQVYDSTGPQQSIGCAVHQDSHACFPLMAQGEHLGALQLILDQTVEHQQARTLAVALSPQIALGLANR